MSIPSDVKTSMRSHVKTLLGVPVDDISKDALIDLFVDKSEDDFHNYTNWGNYTEADDGTVTYVVPPEVYGAIEDYVVYRIQKQGFEGLKSYNEGAVSRTFEEDIPLPVRRVFNKWKAVRFW